MGILKIQAFHCRWTRGSSSVHPTKPGSFSKGSTFEGVTASTESETPSCQNDLSMAPEIVAKVWDDWNAPQVPNLFPW